MYNKCENTARLIYVYKSSCNVGLRMYCKINTHSKPFLKLYNKFFKFSADLLAILAIKAFPFGYVGSDLAFRSVRGVTIKKKEEKKERKKKIKKKKARRKNI